jgi:hypothetical protein
LNPFYPFSLSLEGLQPAASWPFVVITSMQSDVATVAGQLFLHRYHDTQLACYFAHEEQDIRLPPHLPHEAHALHLQFVDRRRRSYVTRWSLHQRPPVPSPGYLCL